jgi:hypothetical protein
MKNVCTPSFVILRLPLPPQHLLTVPIPEDCFILVHHFDRMPKIRLKPCFEANEVLRHILKNKNRTKTCNSSGGVEGASYED